MQMRRIRHIQTGIFAMFFAAFVGGCATTPAAPPPAEPAAASPATDASQPATMSMALNPVSILDAPPARPFLDLGPVLVVDDSPNQDERRFLQVYADELGADGVILESRSLKAVYLVKDAAWREGTPKLAKAADVAVAIAAMLYSGFPPRERAMGLERKVFYRAFRYVSDPLPPRPIPSLDLATALRDELSAAESLDAQLTMAHGLLAEAMLDVPTYVRLRACLAGSRSCG